MSEQSTGKKGVNWVGILLALAAITAVKGIWALKTKEPPTDQRSDAERLGLVSFEQLGIDLSSEAILVDVFHDGRIVVDGSPRTLEELERLVTEWKAAGKRISSYREQPSEEAGPETHAAGRAIFEARLPLSRRSVPQRVEP